MPTVELGFTALPAHVRTARLVAAAVARRAGLDEAVLDELRLAVGEACSRAVELHRRYCREEPIRVRISDDELRLTVVVSDCAVGDPGLTDDTLGSLEDLSSEVAPSGRDGSRGDDAGYDADADADALPAGVGLAVISGLVDSLEVQRGSSGLSVCMSWPLLATRAAPGGARS